MTIKVFRDVRSTRLQKQNMPGADVEWKDIVYSKKEFTVGLTRFKSGTVIAPELTYTEVLLMLAGTMKLEDRRTGKVSTIKKGDAAYLRKGTKVTVTAVSPVEYWWFTYPPHTEVVESYYQLERD